MRDYFSEIDWHLFSDVSRMQELMKMGSGTLLSDKVSAHKLPE